MSVRPRLLLQVLYFSNSSVNEQVEVHLYADKSSTEEEKLKSYV